MKSDDASFDGYNSAGSKDVYEVTSILTTQTHSIPEINSPNSVVIKVDKKGTKVTERYYDKDGKAYLDIDYTDHGNKEAHPVVPHQHKISWQDGNMHRGTGEEINK